MCLGFLRTNRTRWFVFHYLPHFLPLSELEVTMWEIRKKKHYLSNRKPHSWMHVPAGEMWRRCSRCRINAYMSISFSEGPTRRLGVFKFGMVCHRQQTRWKFITVCEVMNQGWIISIWFQYVTTLSCSNVTACLVSLSTRNSTKMLKGLWVNRNHWKVDSFHHKVTV